MHHTTPNCTGFVIGWGWKAEMIGIISKFHLRNLKILVKDQYVSALIDEYL